MDEFDGCRELDMILARVAAMPRGGECQERPNAFAASFDQVSGDFRNPWGMLARHALANEGVDRGHVARERGLQPLDRRLDALRRIHASWLSTLGRGEPRFQEMKEILRTTDPTIIAFGSALLRAEGIDCFVLDVHMSVLEGGIGVFPKRLSVQDKDAFQARAILRDNGVEDLVEE